MILSEPEIDLTIKKIEPGDKLTGLSLGNQEFAILKTFLQKHAKKYETHNLGRTYGIFQSEKIVAYITLTCGEVVAGDDAQFIAANAQEDVFYPYKQYPAVKIARLAVDHRFGKLGLGRNLVNLALGVAKGTICPAVGCRFVMVDAKASATKFYERCGFTMLDTTENRSRSSPVMFLDLNKVED